MTTLVIGASGATGKLLVRQLLKSGQQVKAMVRSTSNIPDSWNEDHKITIVKEDNITQVNVDDMAKYLSDCQAVASCLGHNLTWKGIYGKPRKLVTETVRLICETILKIKPEKPMKFVLMNTTGNSNRGLEEPNPFGEKMVKGILRLLLPPHPDNEKAADFLRVDIGQKNPYIEWTVVRPDSLVDLENVSEYSLHSSPTRSSLFNPGKTSRVNVGHFMAKLITDEIAWNKWKGQMPVIYNETN